MKKIAQYRKLQIEPLKEIINDTELFDHLRSTGSVETEVANILNLKIHLQPAHPFQEELVLDIIFFGTAGQVISHSFTLNNMAPGIELSLASLKQEHETIDVNRLAFRCKEKEFEADVTVYDVSKNEDAETLINREPINQSE